LRRLVTPIVIACLLAALAASSASAFGSQSWLTVNNSTSGPHIALNAYGTGRGHTRFDANIGPIPYPVQWYIVHTVPWWPFKLPSYVGGNSGVGGFNTVATDPHTGRSAWTYSATGSHAGWFDIYTNSQAQAEIQTGTTAYYWDHGTGSGHTFGDTWFLVRVYVP
jgi:hypothetical protein